jgi:hypothetical protein
MNQIQPDLFEPTGPEVGRLAHTHAQWADKALRMSQVFEARGWPALAREQKSIPAMHTQQADELAMLAEFEHLAGIA